MTLQGVDRDPRRRRSYREVLAADPRQCALFLDVDGTLLNVAATPEGVTVPEGLPNLIARLCDGLDGAVAIITGRRIADVDRLLAPLRPIASGVHGAELRTSAGGKIATIAPSLPPDLIEALLELPQRWPGILAEPKGSGMAIHYRLAPDLRRAVEAELRQLLDHRSNELVICQGRRVLEVIPTGLSKGVALRAIAALPAFRRRVPIMIGDDIGDEPAFIAAESLGGFGLRVAGEHFFTDTDFDGPAAVAAWLEGLAEKLER